MSKKVLHRLLLFFLIFQENRFSIAFPMIIDMVYSPFPMGSIQ